MRSYFLGSGALLIMDILPAAIRAWSTLRDTNIQGKVVGEQLIGEASCGVALVAYEVGVIMLMDGAVRHSKQFPHDGFYPPQL